MGRHEKRAMLARLPCGEQGTASLSAIQDGSEVDTSLTPSTPSFYLAAKYLPSSNMSAKAARDTFRTFKIIPLCLTPLP